MYICLEALHCEAWREMEKNGRSEAASAGQRDTSKLRSPPAATATACVGFLKFGDGGIGIGIWVVALVGKAKLVGY
jgi:hypothetical protein